jgi:hypothetical protein
VQHVGGYISVRLSGILSTTAMMKLWWKYMTVLLLFLIQKGWCTVKFLKTERKYVFYLLYTHFEMHPSVSEFQLISPTRIEEPQEF